MADINQIATLALERTEKGRLLWEATVYQGSFLTTLGNQSLRITYSPETPEDDEGYSLAVLNKDGIELDRLSAGWRNNRVVYDSLKNLFILARRQALDVDKELDELAKLLSTR